MGALGQIAGQDVTNTSPKDMYNRYRRDNRYLFDAQGDAIKRATEIADRPYQSYDGQRVAGLSGNEMLARDRARLAMDGSARQYLERAGREVDEVAGSEWNSETAQRYMNPYTDNVLDRTLERQRTAYNQRRNDLRGQAASRGAFGGDRQTMLETGLEREYIDSVADTSAEGYYAAYNDAFRGWSADNTRRLQAADAYRAVGGDISRMDSAQITDLMRTGQAGRLLEQMQLDADYNEFITERDWDVTNLQPLLQAISSSREGAAMPMSQSTGAGQAIGAIASLVGMFAGSGSGGGASGGTGGGMGTAAPVTGYQGSMNGDFFTGGNSGVGLA